MALNSFSKFYYIGGVSLSNQNINFDEGGGELLAAVEISSYTIEELALAVKTALDAAGTLVYTVDFDRDTRKFTISATGSFDLLVSTGTQASTSIFDLLGFTGGDLTGASSYTADSVAGSQYKVQFKLQDYVAENFLQERIQPNVNESASGELEVVSFGTRKFIEMNLLFITNLPMDGKVIRNNPSGVEDSIAFLEFATTKAPLEFMPDESDPDTFTSLILESTENSSNGLGFLLKEETGKNLPGVYRTGLLKWRVK